MTYEDRVRLIGGLAASFPRDHATGTTLAEYARQLADIPEDDLKAIVDEMKRGARAFPTMAEIREAYIARRRPERLALPSYSLAPAAPMPESIKRQMQELEQNAAVETIQVEKEPERHRGPVPACSGVGKPAVLRGGKWVCPDCGA